MTKILFDFDDLHCSSPVNCMSSIDLLCKEIPNIKLLFFTIPLYNNIPIHSDLSFCNRLREHINNKNVEIAVHGTTHSILEYKDKSYDDSYKSIELSIKIFKDAGIPIRNIFKGPYWGLNKNTVDALISHKFTHIFNHEEYMYLENDSIKFVYYNWNLKDSFDERLLSEEFIVAHGHTWDVCDNGIVQVTKKIIDTLTKYPQLIPTHI